MSHMISLPFKEHFPSYMSISLLYYHGYKKKKEIADAI